MRTVTRAREMQEIALAQRRRGDTIGLVPTMGFLHEGHLALMKRARSRCDLLVVSIFVNPMQFGPGEDFDRYPRDLERDLALCRGEGVGLVFHPGADDMYAAANSTVVEETDLSAGLCGASRREHFRGVTTIVAKLFNIVQPDIAVFGQKDAQQAAVIRRMVRDLNFPVQIDVAPIVREPDGLAMSSRNTYLSPEERIQALSLSRGLGAAERAYAEGERHARLLIECVRSEIRAQSLAEVEYVAAVDAETLAPVDRVDGPVLLALAVRFGRTRLIDNTILGTVPDML